MRMKVLLIRHGKTIFNTQGKVQGWSDTPLTEAGRAGAMTLGKNLAGETIDGWYASDSGRARETASILQAYSNHAHLPLHEHEGLREVYFGTFEGGFNSAMLESLKEGLSPKFKDVHMMWDVPVPDVVDTLCTIDNGEAESWDVYEKRVTKAMKNVVKHAKEENCEQIAIVSHGFTIRTLIHVYGYSGEVTDIENCSMTEIDASGESFIVNNVNTHR